MNDNTPTESTVHVLITNQQPAARNNDMVVRSRDIQVRGQRSADTQLTEGDVNKRGGDSEQRNGDVIGRSRDGVSQGSINRNTVRSEGDSQHRVSVTAGEDTITVTGSSLDLVRTAMLMLEKYFLNFYIYSTKIVH